MSQKAIFFPFFALMLLTIFVWVYMYYLRLSFILRKKIDPQALATTREVLNVIPVKLNTPSENLINLFELPVLFYATCIYLYITQQVDTVFLVLAYGFLTFRIIHSVIHCTYNTVTHRFYSYLFSAFTLWAFIILACLRTLQT